MTGKKKGKGGRVKKKRNEKSARTEQETLLYRVGAESTDNDKKSGGKRCQAKGRKSGGPAEIIPIKK